MMAEEFKLLGSRRAYEFRMDDLRLSLLCLPDIRAQIQQMFSFEGAALGTPQETFGPVAMTLPPGMVFNIGLSETPREPAVPIRFLHFEQQRIVIDVAGPSTAIDPIFERIEAALALLTTSDGAPAMGQVERVIDYSEFSGQFAFSLIDLFRPEIRDALVRATSSQEQRKERLVAVPTITLSANREDEEYHGLSAAPVSYQLQIATRAGTLPADNIGFSGAPLDSDSHRRYLSELGATLANGKDREREDKS